MKRAVICLCLALVGMLVERAPAGCCNDCGCDCQCCKVCRCVPTVKKVPKITYCCECEDFCVPGPSKICGYKCVCPEPDACEHDCDEGCHKPWLPQWCHQHPHKEIIWQPGCAEIRTRHKLVKKETIKEVKSWKWEVVDLCPHCNGNCKQAQTSPGQVPAAMLAEAQAAEAAEAAAGEPAASEPTAPAAQVTENKLVSHTSPVVAAKSKLMNLFSK